MLLAWLVILVPFWLEAPSREPIPIAIGQVVIAGVILGAGRQGVDVLLLRLLAASMALLVGSLLIGSSQSGCSGVQSCAQLAVLGILAFGIFGSVVLGLVALPTTILWSRGVATLKPEVRWPVPQRWWQWLLLVVSLLIVLPFLGVLLGIPWPG